MADDELPASEHECFFIAPIGDEGSDVRKRSDGVLDFIVGRAAEELGLSAVRADRIAKPGSITLQVIEHVLTARAAVADLTGSNANVFYELAIRHTARLPTVLIAEVGQKLPFDVGQMRTTFFDHTDLKSADECRRAIVAQLREAFKGAVDSPVATAVDVRAMQAGNPLERMVAELVQSVAQVEALQQLLVSESLTSYGLWEDESHLLQHARALLSNFSVLEARLIESGAMERSDALLRDIHSSLVMIERGLAMPSSLPSARMRHRLFGRLPRQITISPPKFDDGEDDAPVDEQE